MSLEICLENTSKKNCDIQVFGLGYVGFPLSIRLASSGFNVIGIDVDSNKIENFKKGDLVGSHLLLKNAFLHAQKNKKFVPSTIPISNNIPQIAIICVPTPISESLDESNKYVFSAVKEFLNISKKGDVIILESSIMVGTTEKIKQMIESCGFQVGIDFGLCFCPERIDPLNKKWKLENIPRIIFSYDDTTFEIAKNIYAHVNNASLTRVKSPATAEVVKSFENTFRLVNISLVNELAMLCDKLNINVKEVIDAASTKPFGFMPFYPGAGAGGHCIPKDPKFLISAAKKLGMNFQTIENAIKVNHTIPRYIADSIEEKILELKLSKSVLVCGLAYKPDIEDMRDSAGFRIISELKSRGVEVFASDPYYKKELEEKYMIENNIKKIEFDIIELENKMLERISCLCVVQNHTKTIQRIQEVYDKSLVPFIYDCQNFLQKNPKSTTFLKGFGGISLTGY